jgi:hypothetical protein
LITRTTVGGEQRPWSSYSCNPPHPSPVFPRPS